ncbi:MAG: cytochrome c biogenesis protein ResB, partial [Candidatus Aminicenantaceae bacterium]
MGMKSINQFFSSVKLTIILLILIIILLILGTLIPQNRNYEEYVTRYGQISTLLIKLGLTRIYHSLGFIILLFLFSLNLIFCSLNRLSPKLRKTFHPKIEISEKSLSSFKINEGFYLKPHLKDAKEEIKKILSLNHYKVKEKKIRNRTFLLARKRTLGLFGSDIVHAGLFIIVFGGIISSIWGVKMNLDLCEGQTSSVPGSQYSLKLEEFRIEFYPNNQVKDWKSKLTLIEDEKLILTRTIEVNHPLAYKGFVFYQSSYRTDWTNSILEIQVKKRNDDSFLETIHLKAGERAKLSHQNYELLAPYFLPDFVIDESGNVRNRSNAPDNPAVFIVVLEDGKKIFSNWVFKNYPDFSKIHSEKEENLFFQLGDIRPGLCSVIQVSRDPGADLIWIG